MGVLQYLLRMLFPISLPKIISLFQLYQMSLLAVTWFVPAVGPISIYLIFGSLEVSVTPYYAHQMKYV